MKILHVMPSLARTFGGPTQSWVGYARAAALQGVEVAVAAPAVSEADGAWLASRVPGVTFRFFGSAGKGGMAWSPGLQYWLMRKGRQFDAIHVHGLFNPLSSLALRQCVRRKWPVVLRPFGTLSRYTMQHRRSWLKRKYFHYLDGPSLQQAGGVHFTTPAERDEAAWHGLDFNDRSYIVPPPLHGLPQAPAEGRRGARPDIAAAGASADAPLVLFLSRIHPKKNIECLLASWEGVHRVHPRARLVIAGDGDADYVARLKDAASRIEGGGRVTFAGFVEGERKTRLLEQASVFVLPSFQENFGVAVMEAVSHGLPVVISKHVQLASFISEHQLGHVIEPAPDDLAFSISEILQCGRFRQHCRLQGPASVQRNFSLNTVGQQLVEMYRSVIDQHIN